MENKHSTNSEETETLQQNPTCYVREGSTLRTSPNSSGCTTRKHFKGRKGKEMAHDIKEVFRILKPHGLSTSGVIQAGKTRLSVCMCAAPQASALPHQQEGGHVHHQTSQADHYKDSSIFSYSLVGGKLGAVVSFVLEAEDFQQIGDYSASSMGQVFKQF